METPFQDETLLARWLSGELTEEERQEVERHPGFEQWRKIVEATDHLSLPVYDQETAWTRLQKAKGDSSRVAPKGRSPLRLVPFAIAAAIALLLGFFFLYPGQSTFETTIGEKNTITLPDNSIIELNAVSRMAYTESSYEEARSIDLAGEAYFDVLPGVPFTVTTDRAKVRVLGTRFNVFDRPEGLTVTCYEGSVAVEYSTSERVTLVAGEMAKLSRGKLLKESLGTVSRPNWLDGFTLFKDAYPPAIFQELMRQYQVTIQYDRLPNETFSIPMPHDSLESALEIVCQPMGLNFIFVDDNTVRIEEQ